MIDKELLNILACPVCKGDIEYKNEGEVEKLKCKNCKRVYPVEDGIPIMLEEEAKIED